MSDPAPDPTDTDELYPEHAKQRPHLAAAEAIGGFIESSGFVIAVWDTKTECGNRSNESRGGEPRWKCLDGTVYRADWARQIDRVQGGTYKGPDHESTCDECDGTGEVEAEHPQLVRTEKTTTRILAEYFDLDLDKIEDERRQMLEALRNA